MNRYALEPGEYRCVVKGNRWDSLYKAESHLEAGEAARNDWADPECHGDEDEYKSPTEYDGSAFEVDVTDHLGETRRFAWRFVARWEMRMKPLGDLCAGDLAFVRGQWWQVCGRWDRRDGTVLLKGPGRTSAEPYWLLVDDWRTSRHDIAVLDDGITWDGTDPAGDR